MNRIKHVFVLAVDFIGLLIIGSIILFALNYFEILSLSKTFPKYFSFLPQVSQEKVVLTPTHAPASSEIKWDNQAEPALVSNYFDYFKNRYTAIAVLAENGDLFLVDGALTAYNKNYMQIITSQGITVFQIDSSSVFRKISPLITSKSQGNSGENRVTAIYKSFSDFFSDAPFGGFLQIIYQLNGDSKLAVSVDYYPEYKY